MSFSRMEGLRKLKVAIVGSRGIPVNFGAFETLAEEISIRLVKKGHEVTVYCCGLFTKGDEDMYKGVRRVILPSMRVKGIERALYGLLSLVHVLFQKVDVILLLGVGFSPSCVILRLVAKKAVIIIDGFNLHQKKRGNAASWYQRFSEHVAGTSSATIVTCSKWLREQYKKRYGKDSVYIAYGADMKKYPPGEMLRRLGLEPKEYILFVGPFEPENNPLMVREVFDEIGDPVKKLVMVGDAPGVRAYAGKVKETTNPHVVFTGSIFRKPYKELQSNAYFYIEASEAGGPHPELVEAMGAGNCVLATDLPEHREVLKDAGILYRGKEDLRRKMAMLMKVKTVVEEKGKAAVKIAGEEYAWDKVAARYEMLFQTMTARPEAARESGESE